MLFYALTSQIGIKYAPFYFAIFCDNLSNILLCKQQLWIRQTTIVEFFEYLMLKSNLTAIAITYSPYNFYIFYDVNGWLCHFLKMIFVSSIANFASHPLTFWGKFSILFIVFFSQYLIWTRTLSLIWKKMQI